MFEFSYSGTPPYGRFDNTIILLLASYLCGGETAIHIFSLEETPLLRQTATFWNPTLYLFGHPNTNLVPRVSHLNLTAPLLARSSALWGGKMRDSGNEVARTPVVCSSFRCVSCFRLGQWGQSPENAGGRRAASATSGIRDTKGSFHTLIQVWIFF